MKSIRPEQEKFSGKLKVSTPCPRSIAPFYIVSSYIKWVKTTWAYSKVYKAAYIDCSGL